MGREAWWEAPPCGPPALWPPSVHILFSSSPFTVKPALQQDSVNRCHVYTAPGRVPRPRAVWNHTSLRNKLFLPSWGRCAGGEAALSWPQVGASSCFKKSELGQFASKRGAVNLAQGPPSSSSQLHRGNNEGTRGLFQVPDSQQSSFPGPLAPREGAVSLDSVPPSFRAVCRPGQAGGARNHFVIGKADEQEQDLNRLSPSSGSGSLSGCPPPSSCSDCSISRSCDLPCHPVHTASHEGLHRPHGPSPHVFPCVALWQPTRFVTASPPCGARTRPARGVLVLPLGGAGGPRVQGEAGKGTGRGDPAA